MKALPGADDPAFVHCDPTWSPDGGTLVFARAPGAGLVHRRALPLATHPNDPNETPMRYDLYRMPFGGGRGGQAGADRGRLGQRRRATPSRRSRPTAGSSSSSSRRTASSCGPTASCGSSRSAGGDGAPDGVQHLAHELLAQLQPQRPLDGVLVEGEHAVHPALPHPPGRGRPQHAADPGPGLDAGEPRRQPAGVRQHRLRRACSRSRRRRVEQYLHLNRATELGQQDRWQEAATAAQQALAIDPDSVKSHLLLGTALWRTGRPDEGLSHYERGHRARPGPRGGPLQPQPRALPAGPLRGGDRALPAGVRDRSALGPASRSLRPRSARWPLPGPAPNVVATATQRLQQAPADVASLLVLASIRATAADPALRDGAEAERLARGPAR